MVVRASADINETFYCTDEGQGIDHKCLSFFQGVCFRKERCIYQLSEYQLNELKQIWDRKPDVDQWTMNISHIIRGM